MTLKSEFLKSGPGFETQFRNQVKEGAGHGLQVPKLASGIGGRSKLESNVESGIGNRSELESNWESGIGGRSEFGIEAESGIGVPSYTWNRCPFFDLVSKPGFEPGSGFKKLW